MRRPKVPGPSTYLDAFAELKPSEEQIKRLYDKCHNYSCKKILVGSLLNASKGPDHFMRNLKMVKKEDQLFIQRDLTKNYVEKFIKLRPTVQEVAEFAFDHLLSDSEIEMGMINDSMASILDNEIKNAKNADDFLKKILMFEEKFPAKNPIVKNPTGVANKVIEENIDFFISLGPSEMGILRNMLERTIGKETKDKLTDHYEKLSVTHRCATLFMKFW